MLSIKSVRPTTQFAPASLARWGTAAALVALAGVLVWHLGTLLSGARIIISYPYGLDYGEGIVWQQMRNILKGEGYGTLGVYPAIVYHYPPVYHLLVGGLARKFGSDPLATGRAVSLASSLISAGLIGWLTAEAAARRAPRPAAILCGAIGGMIFLACEPVLDWASLMRVDMLACALSLAGLVLARRSMEQPRWIVGAAICFVLAVYTKQVSVAAPAAAMIGLATARPRLLPVLIGLCLAFGVAALALLNWATDGGFLRHILIYNLNRVRPEMISALVYPIRRHLVLVGLALAGAMALGQRARSLWQERERHRVELGEAAMLIAYFVIKTVMLVMIVKSGANLNYTIEWFCAVAIVAGVALATPVSHALGRADEERSPLLSGAILLGLTFQIWSLPVWNLTGEDSRREACRMTPLVEIIASSPRPVISDEMTLLLRAHRDVAWEPAIVAELASVGRYDQPAFVRLVRAHRFGLFVTEGDRNQSLFRDRYNAPVAAAMAQAYPHTASMKGYTLHFDDQQMARRVVSQRPPACLQAS